MAPFAGIGLGGYGVAAVGTDAAATGGTKFGGMLTAGIEMRRFRLALEYNLIPSSETTYTGPTPNRTTISIPNSYFAVTFGVVLGRGTWGR